VGVGSGGVGRIGVGLGVGWGGSGERRGSALARARRRGVVQGQGGTERDLTEAQPREGGVRCGGGSVRTTSLFTANSVFLECHFRIPVLFDGLISPSNK